MVLWWLRVAAIPCLMPPASSLLSGYAFCRQGSSGPLLVEDELDATARRVLTVLVPVCAPGSLYAMLVFYKSGCGDCCTDLAPLRHTHGNPDSLLQGSCNQA